MIYFVQAGDGGPIKIGYTHGHPARRIAALQTGHSEPLRILATIEGNRAQEQMLHAQFSMHRKNGEWFEPVQELLDYIANPPALPTEEEEGVVDAGESYEAVSDRLVYAIGELNAALLQAYHREDMSVHLPYPSNAELPHQLSISIWRRVVHEPRKSGKAALPAKRKTEDKVTATGSGKVA